MPIGVASPTCEELSAGIAVLAGEMSEAFARDRWVILNSATDQVKWRLYDGAALRHCCRLQQQEDGEFLAGPGGEVHLPQARGRSMRARIWADLSAQHPPGSDRFN
jgi:hypothetical protein